MDPLSVLVVEDSEDDMLLMLRELRQGGYLLDFLRVETPAAMQAALDRQSWDLVIADYTLPSFSAPHALQLLQQRQQDLPFIIVSGTIGEETAVAAMKAGAHDYITKGNLARLVPAVQRELREATERQKRQQAERALRESEERFRQLAENVSESVFWMAEPKAGRFLYVSPTYERIWGRSPDPLYENCLAWLECIHPEERQRVQTHFFEQALTGQYDEEYRLIRPDGSVRWIHDRGFPIPDTGGNPDRVVGIATDITEKKHLELQFYRAQRLESLGTLASGIAHDLNNVLTPILAISQLLSLPQFNLDARSQQMLKMLDESAKRGATMIKQILTFARGTDGDRHPIQVVPLLQELISVIQQTFPKSIAIQVNLPDGQDNVVLADSTYLHQVVMNLCVNARDAMPDGGVLSLSVNSCFVDAAFVQTHGDPKMDSYQMGKAQMGKAQVGTAQVGTAQVGTVEVGNYVVITVADTGTGIPLEVRDRIFDPFFTTKPAGQGTGLGLATVLGIVKNYGGFLQVVSELGQGTQVKVYLPKIAPLHPLKSQPPPQINGQGTLILLVDDDRAVQSSTQSLLESHDYQVLSTNAAKDAIALYEKHQNEIRLVMLDIMMPDMNGITLIQRLKALNSTVQIVAMSGLPSNRDLALNAGAIRFLPKPYTLEKLLESLSAVDSAIITP